MHLIDKTIFYIEKSSFYLHNQMLKFKFTYGFPLTSKQVPLVIKHNLRTIFKLTIGIK